MEELRHDQVMREYRLEQRYIFVLWLAMILGCLVLGYLAFDIAAAQGVDFNTDSPFGLAAIIVFGVAILGNDLWESHTPEEARKKVFWFFIAFAGVSFTAIYFGV